jgi:hypothetical protein
MEKLLKLLATHGGKIVSTNDLNEMEISQARASNRMYVDEDSLGYVWLPQFHGRFPVTVEEVEMAEWCYPLDVEIPEELTFENLIEKRDAQKCVQRELLIDFYMQIADFSGARKNLNIARNAVDDYLKGNL